jgi:hypothetical protein
LEFTLSLKSELSAEMIRKELTNLITNQNCKNDEIIQWIEVGALWRTWQQQ